MEEWEALREKGWNISLSAGASKISFLENAAQGVIGTIDASRNSLITKSDVSKWFASVPKLIVAAMPSLTSTSLLVTNWTNKPSRRIELSVLLQQTESF